MSEPYQEVEPVIPILPNEALWTMFGYLSHRERVLCRQVCHQWFQILRRHAFVMDEKIVYNGMRDYQPTPRRLFDYLLRYDMRYDQFEFHNTMIMNDSRSFWETNGVYIKSVYLHRCQIDNGTLWMILQSCPSLRSLVVENSFNVTPIHSVEDENRLSGNEIQLPLMQNIVQLYLDFPFFTEPIFNMVTSRMPNLRSLSFCGSRILVLENHRSVSNIVRVSNYCNVETVLRGNTVLEYLKTHTEQIKSLNLSCFNFVDETITRIAGWLQLNNVKITVGQSFITKEAVTEFLSKQTQLKSLQLTFTGYEGHLEFVDLPSIICEHLNNLKSLSVSGFRDAICLPRFLSISTLKYLTIRYDGFVEGQRRHLPHFCNSVSWKITKRRNLKYLDISNNKVSVSTVLAIVDNCLNLKCFIISNCRPGVNTATFSHLLRTLVKLEVLIADDCEMIYNYSFGERPEGSFVSYLEQLKNLKYLSVNGCVNLTSEFLSLYVVAPQLQTLSIRDCPRIERRSVDALQERYPALRINYNDENLEGQSDRYHSHILHGYTYEANIKKLE